MHRAITFDGINDVSWQIIPLTDGLGAWRKAWDELNIRLYQGHPFRDSRFVDAMLRYFGTGTEHLCVHHTEGRTDGMLILYPRRAGVWTQFVPAQAQAAPVLIENLGILKELFPALPRRALLIELICQDTNFSPAGLWAENANLRTMPHALTMNIELEGSFEEYWSGRPKKLGQNIRRYRRQTGEAYGAPELRINVAPGMMRDAVARYGNLEASGWKGKAGTAVSPDNVQGQFYSEVMALFAETGQAEVVEYWLGERLAASRLIVLGGTITVMLKTTYDESLAKFAPGRLLLKDYLKTAFAMKKSRAVEFYTDATPDQLAWATGQRHIYHAMFFRSAYLARMHDAYLSVKNRISGIRNKVGTAQDNQGAVPDVRQYEYVEALPPGCTPLLLEGERHSFDLSADWFRLLENKAIFPEINARYYTLERDSKVLGLLPLSLQHTGGRVNQVSGLGNFYSSLYRPLLAPTVTSGELAVCLKKILADTGMDVLRFNAMDQAHSAFTLLESAIHQAGLKPFRFFCFGNWYLPVEGRSFAVYFQGLSSKVQSTIKRREKKFLADGRGRLEIVTGGDRLNDVIEAWDKIYRTSWKVPEPFPEFVPGLIRMCAGRGWLRFGFAYYDDEPIAAQLWIVSHGRAAIYKLAYDEKFSRLSPGTVLTAHLMRHVLDVDKVAEVDYLVGDDAYKKDWMSHRRERWGIIAYNKKTAKGMAGAATQMLGEISRHLGIPKTKALRQKAPMMKWALYPVSDFSRHVVAWDTLNQNSLNSPLLSSRFLLPCLKHFQTGKEKLAILGNLDRPDAMCILVRRGNLIWDTFQPAQAPVGFFLMRPGLELEIVISGLIRTLPGFPLALGITQQDPVLAPRPPDSIRMATINYINTARILIEGSYESYWNARGKNLRQNMRKVQNKLEKDGLKYQLKCISDPAQVKGAIDIYGRLESAGWKALDGTAVQSCNAQGKFYTDMLEAFCRNGCGRIYYLTFNDTIVAMDLCIYQGDTIIILKTSYDEAYKEYSPAMLMHQELFRELFQSGDFHLIEFYGKVMDWHLRWTEDIRMMYHVNVYRWEKIRNIAARSNKSKPEVAD